MHCCQTLFTFCSCFCAKNNRNNAFDIHNLKQWLTVVLSRIRKKDMFKKCIVVEHCLIVVLVSMFKTIKMFTLVYTVEDIG